MDDYSERELKEFEQLYGRLLEVYDEMIGIIENPTVGDLEALKIKEVLETIKEYKEKVPAKLREKFSLNINKLERGLLDLQKDFINNKS